ncbi:hypothetical protein BHM03_00035818 [Ensete ventricosum]|nr:hypothetical protein BHM03_00035818 [Ensete ventricosum]
MVCNSAAVAESAGYSSYKIDAVGGVIGLRQRYKVVVVPGIQQRVTENKHRRNPSSVDRAHNLVIAPSTKGAKGSCPVRTDKYLSIVIAPHMNRDKKIMVEAHIFSLLASIDLKCEKYLCKESLSVQEVTFGQNSAGTCKFQLGAPSFIAIVVWLCRKPSL